MKVVYVHDPGVLAVVLSEHPAGIMVKWFLDGFSHREFLEEGEYVMYEEGDMDV